MFCLHGWNSECLAESFIPVHTFTVATFQLWPSRTGFCLLHWGYSRSSSRSGCGFQLHLFDVPPLPCGLHQLKRLSPHQNKLLGALAFEKHVTVNVLFLLKYGLSSCLSFSVRCQRIKAEVPVTKNRRELHSSEKCCALYSLPFKMVLLPKWLRNFSAFLPLVLALLPMEGGDCLAYMRWTVESTSKGLLVQKQIKK